MNQYYQPEKETASRDQISSWQLEGLKKTVQRMYDHVPYYRAKLEVVGLEPGDIRYLEDIRKLPTLSKDDRLLHAA